jgi:hypothetical protein
MRIVDPHYRTMRQLKNDPRLPLITMSIFDHFAKATLSSPMISLTIPLARQIRITLAWPLHHPTLPHQRCIHPGLPRRPLAQRARQWAIPQETLCLKRSHATLGYFSL